VVGTRLGRYDILRTLARGALTDLLLGRASGMEGFQRHVAIKRLREEAARDPACLEMFVNEARLAAALHHHNIVQVLDIGEGGGHPFFAMEYVHGVDLRTLLGHLAKRSEQLPIQHVISIIAAAAAALHHAHEQRGPDGQPLGIVHRQVTPSNLLVGYDGNVKIVDFGIAKAAIKRSQTGVGVLRGSAPYMAPEQCAGRTVDRRSDVFALGIVLYELSTVRRLFKGATEFLTMSAVVNAEVPRPSQYRRDIPSELEVIMLKALARDPIARYQTAGDMAEALDRVARIVGVGASTTQLANYMKLQFGEQKEPWLLGAVERDPESTQVDFDGAASGLAPPPTEAVKNHAIPRAISATKSSPIQKARTSVVSSRAKTTPPIDRSFSVATTVDDEPLGIQGDTITQPLSPAKVAAEGVTEPDVTDDVDASDAPPVAGPRMNDMTAIVSPLPVVSARAATEHAERSPKLVWIGGGLAALVAIIGVIAMWPGAEVTPAPSVAPPAVREAEPTPARKSALEMTAREYEEARRAAEAEPAPQVVPEPERAPEPAPAEPERVADAPQPAVLAEPVKPEKPAQPVASNRKPVPSTPAVRPAPKAPKRTTKPAPKRTPAKQPAKPTTKPKWNPDDLFLGD
jgi:serine/threonine protein kinase